VELKMLTRIVQEDAPPPSSRREDIPTELEYIVGRALARDRSVRYATAREVERDLAGYARAADLDDSPQAVADFLRALFPGEDDPAGPVPRARGTGRVDPDDEPSMIIVGHDGVARGLPDDGEVTSPSEPGLLARLAAHAAAPPPVVALLVPPTAPTAPTRASRRVGLTITVLAVALAAGGALVARS